MRGCRVTRFSVSPNRLHNQCELISDWIDDELLGRHVLEQEAAGPRAQRLVDVLVEVERGEHEHAHGRLTVERDHAPGGPLRSGGLARPLQGILHEELGALAERYWKVKQRVAARLLYGCAT